MIGRSASTLESGGESGQDRLPIFRKFCLGLIRFRFETHFSAPSKVARNSRRIEFPNRLEKDMIQLFRVVSNPVAMNFNAFLHLSFERLHIRKEDAAQPKMMTPSGIPLRREAIQKSGDSPQLANCPIRLSST